MSSSEELYIGGVEIGVDDALLFPGADISDSEGGDSSSDPELSCAMHGAGDGDKGKGKAKRRRVRPLVTTGRFWGLVGTRTHLGGRSDSRSTAWHCCLGISNGVAEETRRVAFPVPLTTLPTVCISCQSPQTYPVISTMPHLPASCAPWDFVAVSL